MNDMMNAKVFNEHWNEIKSEVKKQWGRLPDSDIEQAKGDPNKLTNLVQKTYGITGEEVKNKMKGFLSRYDH